MRMITLIVGGVLGFAGGIYLGVHHPELASSLDAQREKWVLEGKKEATEAISKKLDDLLNKPQTAQGGPTPGPSLAGGSVLDGGGAPSGGDATTDALRKMRDEQKKQVQDMQAKIDSMGKK